MPQNGVWDLSHASFKPFCLGDSVSESLCGCFLHCFFKIGNAIGIHCSGQPGSTRLHTITIENFVLARF
jgi:hypothetical protein